MVILSRMAKVGIPLTVAAATVGAFFYDDLRYRFTLKAAKPVRPSAGHLSSPRASSLSTDLFPRNKWHTDWDSRDPMSLVDQEKYEAADAATRKEMLEKVKATATRNIFLVRHGQYFMETKEKNLTPLGREQALLPGKRLVRSGIKFDWLVTSSVECAIDVEHLMPPEVVPIKRKFVGREQAILLGKRLAQSGQKFDVLIMSPKPRASETAALILNEMTPLSAKVDSLLEEGAPYPPEPPISHWRPKQRGSRIEAAFRKYIHRASPKQKQDSYEILVCHGNVIRYFICRALQFPPEGWLRMSVGNCSITWLVIRPNGNVSLRSLGDIGHLPREKVTFT
ncbi:unnamed protein product [Toxocara canis]|uniref:Serine/threonine-protein phosphatase PGAM5, mitochondrial n=1 Tax=Toxocara canis TaxID=6265 RepID=A0A183TWD4_TOXCA|nr:unnamed protein product [Toxocara canis]